MCTRWYIQGRGRNRFQAGACRGRCGGRRSRDRFFVFSKGLGEYILLTLSNSTSSIAASDPTNYAPFFLLCLPQQNNPTPYSSSSLQFKVQTLMALEVEVKSSEWERVPYVFTSRLPVPVPPTAPLWFLPLKSLDWLESDLKGSVVLFLGWVVGGLDFELGFNWAQDDSLNLLGLGWAGLG